MGEVKEKRIFLRDTPGGHVMTTSMVANCCGVATRTACKWSDDGRIPHHRIPGSNDRRFYARDVLTFMRRERMRPPTALIKLVEGKPGVVFACVGPPTAALIHNTFPDAILLPSVFDFAVTAADPLKYGVVVLGEEIPVVAVREVLPRVAERWSCIHSHGDDQQPVEGAAAVCPAADPGRLFKLVTHFLEHRTV